MTAEEQQKEELANLRAQLAQLNARANHQEDHAWKMPLSVLALAGVFVVQMFDHFPYWPFWAAVAIATVMSLLCVAHYRVTVNGLHHTIDRIREIERLLELPQNHFDERERVRRLLPKLH